MIDLEGLKKEQQKQNFELKIKRPEINPVAHLALSQFFLLSVPLIFTGRVQCEKNFSYSDFTVSADVTHKHPYSSSARFQSS